MVYKNLVIEIPQDEQHLVRLNRIRQRYIKMKSQSEQENKAKGK